MKENIIRRIINSIKISHTDRLIRKGKIAELTNCPICRSELTGKNECYEECHGRILVEYDCHCDKCNRTIAHYSYGRTELIWRTS